MKKLMITAAALLVAVAAYGQGQFVFNTHDTAAGNVLTFVDQSGAKVASPDWFLQVLVNGAPITGDAGANFAINRSTASGPTGFTNPFSQIYTVAGQPKGSTVTVGAVAYQGTATGFGSATTKVALPDKQMTLSEPPTPPGEVALGSQTITLSATSNVPEPATWALGLLGLGSLLAIRRRK